MATNQLWINNEVGVEDQQLIEHVRTISSTETGTITIQVTSGAAAAALAGLAIREATLASIHGRKIDHDTGQGLEGWTIFIDENDNGMLDGTAAADPVTEVSGEPILDYQILKSELQFSGLRAIEDIEVSINITHTFAADLNVFLISPEGTRVELIDDLGGFGDNFTDTVFDDEAATSISTITSAMAPFTGSFRPLAAAQRFVRRRPQRRVDARGPRRRRARHRRTQQLVADGQRGRDIRGHRRRRELLV